MTNDNQEEQTENVVGMNGVKVDATEKALLLEQREDVKKVMTLFQEHDPVGVVLMGIDEEGTFVLYDSTSDVRNTVYMLEHAKSGIINR